MQMFAKWIFALTLLAPIQIASAAEPVIKVMASGDGVLRLQKIETSFVTNDAFAGLFGDSITITPGEYRLQLLPLNGENILLYIDLMVDDVGNVTTISKNMQPSSLVHGRQRMIVQRVDAAISKSASTVELTISHDRSVSRKTMTVLPFTDSTAWSNGSLKRAARQTVSITTSPAGAEVWVNGKRMDFTTDSKFGLAVNDGAVNRNSVLVRKLGFANAIFDLPTGEPKVDIKLNLQALK